MEAWEGLQVLEGLNCVKTRSPKWKGVCNLIVVGVPLFVRRNESAGGRSAFFILRIVSSTNFPGQFCQGARDLQVPAELWLSAHWDPSHGLWAFSHSASQGSPEIPYFAWRTFLGFLSALLLRCLFTPQIHCIWEDHCVLYSGFESHDFQDGSAHLHVASVPLVEGKGRVPPAHCLVSPSGVVHESQSGARGPNVLFPSAPASSATPCPTATWSILNRCCLQHLGLAVRGWEMLT